MNRLTLSLLAAAAALSLQACDIQVHERPSGDASASVTEPAPGASSAATAPAGDSSAGTVAAAPSPQEPGAAPADPSAGVALQAPPAAPDTGAMGAAATPSPDAAGMPPPVDNGAAGVAVPTELARFLEQNPPGARKQDQADAGKADTGRATGKDPKS